jgi:GntR family phosphonate transport system transcriptional regulator
LPAEIELAAQYCVNRHTVRAAIKALMQEGVVSPERGRGTRILQHTKLKFPISKRTRFSAAVEAAGMQASSAILSYGNVSATAEIAQALGLNKGAEVVQLESLHFADGAAISKASNWFCAKRFATIGAVAQAERSITRALKAFEVDDYQRASTVIKAVHADEGDRLALQLSAGAIVLESFAINIDGNGNPIQAARTRFSADRVSLEISGV